MWSGFLETVLERDSPVKDQMLRGRVLIIHGKVAETQELECGRSLGAGEHPLDLAAGEHGQRVRIQALQIVLAVALGVGVGEEVIIQARLGVGAVVCIDPVDRAAQKKSVSY